MSSPRRTFVHTTLKAALRSLRPVWFSFLPNIKLRHKKDPFRVFECGGFIRKWIASELCVSSALAVQAPILCVESEFLIVPNINCNLKYLSYTLELSSLKVGVILEM